MAPKYQDHLAATVLNEGAIVNYRMLSRALKVHSNTAKQMLFDFHRTQNARKAASIHATYILTGTRKPTTSSQPNGTATPDGEDSFMTDGLLSSSMPERHDEEEQIPEISVTLVAEEHLEDLKALHETITSIHVYSIEPGPLSNIHILADCNRKVATEYFQEDPLKDWKQYGTIQNPNTKRRTNKKPPAPPPAQAAPTTAGMKPAQKPTATNSTKQATAEPARPPSRQNSDPPKASTTKQNPIAKREPSNLAKSFAKTKAPPAAAAAAAAKKEDSKAAPEDESMTDAPSEGEDSDGDTELPKQDSAEAKAAAEASRAKRAEKEKQLRDMMDASDEEDEVALPGVDGEEPAKDQEGDSVMTGGEGESEEVADETRAVDGEAQVEEAPEADTSISNGRRRGRRRVMKKKTTKDAEGYLVTREEAVWESFSEDEPEAKRPKIKVGVGGGNGGKKDAGNGGAKGKVGQGNIMSFFGKQG